MGGKIDRNINGTCIFLRTRERDIANVRAAIRYCSGNSIIAVLNILATPSLFTTENAITDVIKESITICNIDCRG
jgi:hypothetical protein